MIVGKASGRGYVRYKNREAIYFVTNLVDLGFHHRPPGPHIRASRNANFLPGSPPKRTVVEAPRLAKRNRGMSALGQSRHDDPGRRSVYVRYTSKSGRKPEPIVTNRPQGRVTPWTAVRSPCDWEERAGGGPCGWLGTYCPGTGGQRRAYGFGEVRVATLALLTFTTLSGRRSSGGTFHFFMGVGPGPPGPATRKHASINTKSARSIAQIAYGCTRQWTGAKGRKTLVLLAFRDHHVRFAGVAAIIE